MIEKAFSALKAIKVGGVSFGAPAALFRAAMMQRLPDTLIFDDIERCLMKPEHLSGLLNRFVEHEKRRVILIANSEQHPEKARFEATREKLVGQVITLKPETGRALQTNWALFAEGKGRTALQARRSLILRTFEEAGHQNLRLLLRAVRDCAELLDSLTPEMLAFETSVDSLVATYLALHMAYHGGELSKEDIRNRRRASSRVRAIMRNEDAPAPDALERVQKRHPSANTEVGYNDVIPVKLGLQLFVDGYVPLSTIQRDLSATQMFGAHKDRPDFVTIWQWKRTEWETTQKALTRTAERMADHSLTAPLNWSHFLALFYFWGSSQRMTSRRTLCDCSPIMCRTQLERKDLLKAATPVQSPISDFDFGFDCEMGTVTACGRSFTPSRYDLLFIWLLKRAMIRVFHVQQAERSTGLLKLLSTNPKDFQALFGDAITFREESSGKTPILHCLPVSETADALISLIQDNCAAAEDTLRLLDTRRNKYSKELSVEAPWMEDLAKELEKRANTEPMILDAQLRFFAGYLRPS